MTEPSANDWVTQREFRSEIRRIDERREGTVASHLHLMAVESARVNHVMSSEADRINSLLLASAQNQKEASNRAEQTAKNLADRVDATAKAVVQTGEATAKANVDAMTAAAMAMDSRIKPLEQARFEGAGRSGMTTPLMMLLSTFAGGLVLYLIQIFMRS